MTAKVVAVSAGPRVTTSCRAESAPGQAKPIAPLFDVTSRPIYIPDYETPRFRLTPNHFAYVKIAEGCNHPCSFCIIPRMRGSHRSRQQHDQDKGQHARGGGRCEGQ